jgi:hypothetical protein
MNKINNVNSITALDLIIIKRFLEKGMRNSLFERKEHYRVKELINKLNILFNEVTNSTE